ncbi:MAG TPA: alpha/beta hydrolase [Roseiflexaceae bacterium]|nr:alpha/beta hydrolase [Roseiflexaceae bacterium]
MSTELGSTTIQAGDAQLNVYDGGQGAAILFLHGNASRWEHWAPQLHALTPQFRCIAFDFRGYGRSGPLPRSNSLSLMADDAAALCGALGAGPVYVVGLSMGGAVAQMLALRHPQLVAGLVAAGPPLIAAPTAQAPTEAPELTAEMLRGMFGVAFSPAFAERNPELVARTVEELLETDIATIRNFSFEDLPLFDLGQIAAPALVIAGELDALAPPAVVHQIAQMMPTARYLELPSAGHMMNVEAAEAFTGALVDFIREHPAS